MKVPIEPPPYNGFGDEEDSLGSWKYLIVKVFSPVAFSFFDVPFFRTMFLDHTIWHVEVSILGHKREGGGAHSHVPADMCVLLSA